VPLLAESITAGPVFEFLVVFAVILLGPIVVSRVGLPGLIGFLLGGFLIGPHGLNLIQAGNQTVPELGQLGILYLMFVAGLELDLQILREYRRAAVGLGLLAFVIPAGLGLGVGFALGWSLASTILLGALLSSHTLIVYPTLREAGLDSTPPVATAVGATVLTDTLALIVLAVVAGTQTDPGSAPFVVGKIAVGFVVLGVVGLAVLPRLVDAVLRQWGSDQVTRYLVMFVALLAMALLAEVFGIEGIVGAFFGGIALNPLVPNEGPSMEQVDFFGAAVFVPIFLVSIGLLLDPSVMFTSQALSLAALICVAAMGGKAIACWLAGAWLGFTWPERAAMYVLTTPQAAATLAVTLIGFEIGLFGTTVVNAVLVLIMVSILASAVLAQRVTTWMPASARGAGRLGARVLVVTTSTGPTDPAMRAATLLARPDGGSTDLLITRGSGDPPPDAARLRSVRKRITRHGFEGELRVELGDLDDAVERAALTGHHSLIIVDDPAYEGAEANVPLLVLDGTATSPIAELIPGATGDGAEVAADIRRRLARDAPASRSLSRDRPVGTATLGSVEIRGTASQAGPPGEDATAPSGQPG
jgi:Kef-type K+ transport system membrane component KefB